MSDPGSHEPELRPADHANRLQLQQPGGVGVGAGRGRRVGAPRAAPQLGVGGFYSEGTGGYLQGTVPRPSRGNTGGVLGKVWRVVSSAMGTPAKFPADVSIPGQAASGAPDALGRGLVDSAEMVRQVGTEQGGGEVSGLDQGRETTSSDPTERCGEPAVAVYSSAQLGSVLQTSHLPEFPEAYTGPRAYEERSFTDSVTLGPAVGFRSAPGSPTATYENHETMVGELSGKPACEVAKASKTPTQAELAGNTGKARVTVTLL